MRRGFATSSGNIIARLAPYDVIFVRHGNTGPPPPAGDLARTLTEKGKSQCAAAAATFAAPQRLRAPRAAFAVASPALRTLETARLVLAPEPPRLVELPTIYDGLLQPGASDAFQRLGYNSLFAYREDGEATRDMLSKHGEAVVSELAAVVARQAEAGLEHDGTPPPPRQTLFVFGHAVYLSAAAMRLASLRGHEHEACETILHAVTGEACGFWVGDSTSETVEV